MELRTLEAFLNELCPRVRPLIAQAVKNEFDCEVLDFFQRRANTSFEVYDIGYHLRRLPEQLDQPLRSLVVSGLLRCRVIFGLTFYSLTDDPEMLQALEKFWDWREAWRAYLDQLKLNFHFTTEQVFVDANLNQPKTSSQVYERRNERTWRTNSGNDPGSAPGM